eukprot:Phypoly_transcript_00195.p1 GENE.Phypoly_transcript_00195~~Phypoly_transcript_00195.p1  ORF type:complete len:2011 (-),score=530.90 Phypoly_transcript_00195:36-5696(-)
MAIRDIFSHIESSNREFLLRVSYMEIYNEVIQDLLNPEAKNLKIHEDIEKGIYVGGIKEAIVVSAEQVLALMQSGEDRRHVGATNMNEHSSRSHTIFRMVIESRERSTGGDRKSVDGAVKVSMLNLVDLAGSERIAHTGAEGIRQKEGGHINKSLLALSTVIAKLSEGKSQVHIPYRDSKLTRILQTALGGNARTAIICTVTPAAVHQEETLSTIKFATRAKNIKNKPVINEVVDEATMLRKYKDEIHALKQQLAQREVVIEQKVEDNSAKQTELETLNKQIEQLKGLFVHSSAPNQGDDGLRRRPKRSARRETWCPGEGMLPPGAVGGMGGMLMGTMNKSRASEDSDDLAADIDKELGFGHYRIPDHPIGFTPSFGSSRKRVHPSESPIPISLESSLYSEEPSPKQLKPLITPEKLPAFQRAELLLSAKKVSTPTKDSGDAELLKELTKQKTLVAEYQSQVSRLQSSLDTVNEEKQNLQTEYDAVRQELEKMVALAKTSYADLENARARIEELEGDSIEEWAEEKTALETALVNAQRQTERATRDIASRMEEIDALNEMLSEAVNETDEWKTRFSDLQTEFDLAQANWTEREEELMTQHAEASHAMSTGGATPQGADAWEAKYNELVSQMKELADSRKELEEALAREEQHISSVGEWKAKHLELHNEYDQYIDQVTHEREKLNHEYSVQLKEKEDEIDRLASLLEDKEINRSVLSEVPDASELRAALEEAREETGRLTALLQEQTEKLATMEGTRGEQDAELQSIVAERVKIMEEIAEYTKECERLNGLVTEKENERKGLEELLAEKEKEHEKLNEVLAEKDKECERLTQVAASAQVLQREHSQSVRTAVELRDQLRDAQLRLESAQAAEARAESAAQAKVEEARQEMTNLSAQIVKIREEADAQVAARVAQCQQLESELQNVTEKLNHQLALAGSQEQRIKEAEREAQHHLDSLRALEGNASNSSKKAQQLQTSADLARQQCDSLSVKVADLTKENQKLEAKLSDAERIGRERADLMESVAKYKSEASQSNAAFERQREELTKAQQQAKRLQGILDELNHELDTVKNLFSTSEEKAIQATTENQRLRCEAEERENTLRRDNILRATQLEMKDNEIQRVTAELAELQEECGVMRKDLAQLAAAARDYDRLTNELAQLKTKYSTEAAQWKEESLKLKKELKTSSSTNSSAEKERDQLSREMDKLKQKMETLDGKYKQATQTNCGLEADKVAAERELKQLRKQNADLERNMEKLKATDNKGKETAAALTQMTKTYEANVKINETLTKNAEKLKQDLDAKSTELTKEIEVKVQLEKELAEAKNELEVRAASIETLTREKNEETRLKKETDSVLLITVGKLDDAQRKLVEVEGKVQSMTEELAEACKVKDQAEEEKEKLCSQLTEMHYSVEENRAEWSAKEFELMKERETVTAELSTAKTELAQRETALEELQAAIQEKTNELDTLKGETARLQEELAGAKEELERARGEVDNAQQELARARVEIESAQQELEGARAETANAQQELLRSSAEFSHTADEDKKLLEGVKEELKTTKEILHHTQGENASLRGFAEEKDLELNATKEWAGELQHQVEELRHTEQRAQHLHQQMCEERERLLRDLEVMTDMAREMEKRAGGAEEEARGWRERAEQVAARLAGAEEQCGAWQGRLAEMQMILENADGQVKVLRSENEGLRREIGETREKGGQVNPEELMRVIAERDELRAEFEAFREEAAEKEQDLMSQMESDAKILDKMMDEAREAKLIHDAQFKYQKKIRELLEKLSKFEMDAKRANASCAQKDIEIADLRNELEKKQQEIMADEGTLTKADLLSEVTRLEGVVNELRAELETRKKESSKVENKQKIKMDFDSLYQERRKKPLSEITNNVAL